MPRLRDGRLRLPRRVSLKHRRWLRALFDRTRDNGGSLATGCIRLAYRLVSDADPAEFEPVFVGFSPGSRVRGAVKRNRVKRLLRECYRLKQDILLQALSNRPEALTMMIIFRGDPGLSFDAICSDTTRALLSLASRLKQ